MTNDQTRSNDKARIPNSPRHCVAFRHWGFGFLSTFVIRHSSLTTLSSALVLGVSCSKPAASGATQAIEDAIPITTARVETKPMDRTLDVWGTLYAKDEATLGAQAARTVQRTSA